MYDQKVDLEKIKTIRKKNGISLERMSNLLGYSSPNGYFYLESGKSKFPAEKLAIVSTVLGVPIENLFFKQKVTKMETNESGEVI
ncbi:helix-turn-helix domain-containing protein [Halobacillus salinarum]|uniref:Helix-turn-helix domain-containing protein n=1 Tax=Halobacillus salinarum TaxID=2932257 RepID=A0ABY4EFY6_9BACI|nr:helix-turn-helix transcriptional regulator [Halobacillus salinarum]UOQ43388.1 helix-turn-helix domain-containing protein [Halobacillus salinarum]